MAELDGKQVGTLQQDAVNKTGHQNNQSHNLFDLSHYNALTARFGDLTPFLCKEVVPGDRVRFGSNHELRTLTLSAPVLSPVRMHKDYFFVPMKAILPHWDDIISNQIQNSIYTQPYAALPRFNIYKLYYKVLETFGCVLQDIVIESAKEDPSAAYMSALDNRLWPLFALVRNMVSRGGLLRMLQYPTLPSMTAFDSVHDYIDGKNIEQLIDTVFTLLADKDNFDDHEGFTYLNYCNLLIFSQKVPSALANFSTLSNTLHGNGTGSLGRFLDTLEMFNFDSSNTDVTFTNWSDDQILPSKVLNVFSAIVSLCASLMEKIETPALAEYDDMPEAFVNPCKLVAYHEIAVQFFTNDKVDDITNVREYLSTYWPVYQDGSNDPEWTNVTGPCASAMGNLIMNMDYDQSWTRSSFNATTFYKLIRLLTFNNALKYGDYFIGSKPQPISAGDVSITVDSGKVQAIDVTRNLMVQRLLNAINKLGSSISEYSKGILGEAPKFVDPTPQFLARSTTYIGNPETVNTADEQGKITSQFRSVDGKFEFSAEFSDFGYIVGLVSFDVLPCYPSRVDRDAYHTDFFTFFNPMLQNIGDQAVMLNELDPTPDNIGKAFGYQQRFAEYKSMASYCSGAFAKEGRTSDYYGLQSWLFQVPDMTNPINPYLIRHQRSDFDRFYSAFDGLNLSDYAHFAIIFNNDLKINRKMQFQSTLL